LVAVRVLLLTFGTRGDVQPYVALAAGLGVAGHDVGLCTAEGYRELVESAGVAYLHMSNEMLALVQTGMSQMKGTLDAFRIAKRMTEAMRSSLLDQWEAGRSFDPSIIIYHPKILGGLHVAERLGVPAVVSLPLPFFTPTADFPIPFIARWPLGGAANRLSYQFNRFTAIAYGNMINRFRKETLELSRMSRWTDYLTDANGQPVPVLYGFSRHVVPVPRDYPEDAHVTGYWFLDQADEWDPPADLAAFLAAGEPPVYIGFGSMGFGRHAAVRGRIVLDAVNRVGVRAIVARGWGGLEMPSSSSRVHVTDSVPHDWLFPRTAGVVHHGGAGTTAAGLRAGRPTLVCPVLGDQGFWAGRVHTLGCGPLPLPMRRFSVDGLACRLRFLINDPTYRDQAQEIGNALADEDGVGNAVHVLEHIAL
jgi:UDP:flavonoid glycosyltransferase YjiC (YdhE family)